MIFQNLLLATTLGGLVAGPVLPVLAVPAVMAQAPMYSSEAGRFVVAFPGSPTVSQETDSIEGEAIEVHEHSVEMGGRTYAVLYADMPETFLDLGTETVLDQVRDKVMADWNLQGLEQLEMQLSFDGHPGRQYRYSDGEATLDIRLYLVDERVYLLAAADDNAPAVDQFMNSFALL